MISGSVIKNCPLGGIEVPHEGAGFGSVARGLDARVYGEPKRTTVVIEGQIFGPSLLTRYTHYLFGVRRKR